MSTHYNAFISYRHVPRDIRIAEMLQKKLEHYRIPRAIQAQTGIRRFDRIFRDKEELPVTSDLNERITEALHNSDYLIVICSEDSVNSRWMQREITTFLQTHSRRQVLTILAGGDPEEVIPEVLRYGESVWQDADSRAAPAEPLYGDLSSSSRRNRNSEVHRIAAAMLDCSYADLTQRQKRYRQRRLTAALCTAAAVMGLLAAYFLWTSLRIQESYLRSEQNYQQALENQSRYLASESLALLEAGDRTTAIQLALAALPSEEFPRPLIPEAEYALTQALYAYNTEEKAMQAVNSFVHHGNVTAFFAPKETSTLWVMDAEDNVYLWSTSDFSLVRKWTGSELKTMGLNDPVLRQLGEERVLIASYNHQLCLDAADGSVLWETEHSMLSYTVNALMDGAKIGFTKAFETSIFILDAKTGTQEAEYVIPSEILPKGASTLHMNFLLSSDGQYLTVYCSVQTDGSQFFIAEPEDLESVILIRNNRNGQWHALSVPGHYITGLFFSSSGKMIALTQDYQDGDLLYTSYSGEVDGDLFCALYPNNLNTLCIDPEAGALLWQRTEVYSLLSATPSAAFLLYPHSFDNLEEAVCCSAANKSYVYSVATGEPLAVWELPAAILNASAGDTAMHWILDNGFYASRVYFSDHISAVQYFAGNAEEAIQQGSQAFLRSPISVGKRTILMYDAIPADSSWQLFRDEPQLRLSDYLDSVTFGTREAILYEDHDGQYVLSVHDLETEAFCFSVMLQEDDTDPDFVQLLYADNRGALVFRSNSESPDTCNELLFVSLSDGSITVHPLPGERVSSGCVYHPEDGSLAYVAGNRWYRVGQDGSVSEESIPADDGSYLRLVIPDRYHGALLCGYYYAPGDRCFLIENTGEVTQLPIDPQDYGYLCAEFSPDGQLLAVTGSDRIQFLNREGSEVGSIPLNGRSVGSVHFLNGSEQIALLCETGELLLFRVSDGTLLRETRLESVRWKTYDSWQEIRWTQDSRGRLVIIRPSYAAAVVDPQYWSCCAAVANCVDYNPERDLFISCRRNGFFGDLGLIRQYSIAELVLRGRELLSGAQLTEEQKLHYGLS